MFQVKPPWVKETLSDSEGEQDGPGAVPDPPAVSNPVTSEPSEPVAEPLDPSSDLISAAPFETVDNVAPEEFAGNPVGAPLDGAGAEAVSMDAGLENQMNSVSVENSVQDETPVPLTSVGTESVAPSADQLELGAVGAAEAGPTEALTEEDLLTGPAHNLDDSQFKPDIVDPNLDDIFK